MRAKFTENLLCKADLVRDPREPELATSHQIGDEVWLWLEETTHIPGFITAVSFEAGGIVSYDVAVQVGSVDLYVRLYRLRGEITKPNGTYPGLHGGLESKASFPVPINPTTKH